MMRVLVELEFEEKQDWEQQKWNMYDSMPLLIDWREIKDDDEED